VPVSLFHSHRSTLRVEGAMDVRTYHTLMMGHTKLLQHLGVLQLYDEALASSIPVRDPCNIAFVECCPQGLTYAIRC
jgi:hypothetical protein